MKKFVEFHEDDVADAFYHEDWGWIRSAMGIRATNSRDAEIKIERWKDKHVDDFKNGWYKIEKKMKD